MRQRNRLRPNTPPPSMLTSFYTSLHTSLSSDLSQSWEATSNTACWAPAAPERSAGAKRGHIWCVLSSCCSLTPCSQLHFLPLLLCCFSPRRRQSDWILKERSNIEVKESLEDGLQLCVCQCVRLRVCELAGHFMGTFTGKSVYETSFRCDSRIYWHVSTWSVMSSNHVLACHY